MGTLSYEDIYGVGTLDTVPAAEETTSKTNPNQSSATGIQHLLTGKNLLGQPLVIWFGLIVLLVAVKYFVEK